MLSLGFAGVVSIQRITLARSIVVICMDTVRSYMAVQEVVCCIFGSLKLATLS